jgi:putative ABC transport system permease protein
MDSLIAANIKQRPVRTMVSIAGVGLGVILVVLFVGLANGLMRDYVERQSNTEAELRFFPAVIPSLTANVMVLPIRYRDAILYGTHPTADDPDIKTKPPAAGVAAVTPVGEWVQASAAGIGFEMVDGIDFPSFAQTTQLKITEGQPLAAGGDQSSPYEAIVDGYYAQHNKDSEGRPVKVGSRIKVFGHSFSVVGIYEPSLLARVKIPLQTLQDLLGSKDNCTYLMIHTDRPDQAEQVKRTLEDYYPGNKIMLAADLPALYSRSIVPVQVFLDVVIGLAAVISALVILLAMYTTILERTREIGILKSLGASKRFIVMAIEKEAAMVSLLGVVFGFLIAVGGKYWIEGNTRLRIDLQVKWLLISAMIGLLGGIIGALYPALRAASLDPVEALDYE